MRRRLLVTYVSLLTVVIAALAVPLAVAIAGRNTRDVFIDRQDDTIRFASLADSALRSGQTTLLGTRLSTYDGLFGITAAVVNADGRLVISSRANPRLDTPEVKAAIRNALAGEGSAADRVVWPWQTRPLVVAEPVGHGGEIIGVAVTISPVRGIRATTLTGWLWVTGFILLALLVVVYAARRLTGWMLRPVLNLDEATHAIAAGRLAARVPRSAGPAELRRLVASFNTMIDTIEKILEHRRAFVSYAGHQLRNPLATLRIRVENLTTHLDHAGDEDHALTLDEVDRLARVCDGLLALARTESGRPPDCVVVNAVRVAAARITAWKPVAERAGVRMVGPDTGPALVYAPEDTVDQVLDALLDNAIKFAGSGATIAVTIRAGGGQVLIDVVDDGPGLPAEALAGAVQPYWHSTEHSRSGSGLGVGSGLGLAIVATLVAASGGELDLRPAIPHGLHARVRLPGATAVRLPGVTASPGGSSAPPPDAAGVETCPRPYGDSGAAPPDAPPPVPAWR
jgi:signal transduction histidine kinase